MFYTAVWVTGDEKSFRRQMPLELLGASLKRHRSTLPFHLVWLEGIQHLSPAYLEMLTTLGFTVIDHCSAFAATVAAFPNIDAQYSRYERNCLLRWIAFRELFENDPRKPTQFWHLDSDILLHTSLDQLARDTAGKTFMLQGCPVLLTVSNKCWFAIYETNLRDLNRDPSAYSAIAAAEKDQCRINDRLLANRSAYRHPLGSDQDLLEYLVASRRLPQDTSPVIYRGDLFFIENPLSLNLPDFDIQGEKKLYFEMKENAAIFIGNKRVPFIHYQSGFTRYAQVYCLMVRWRLPGWLIKAVLRYRVEEDKFETTIAFRVLAKLWFGSKPGWGRSRLMTQLSGDGPGPSAAGLLNFLTQYARFR